MNIVNEDTTRKWVLNAKITMTMSIISMTFSALFVPPGIINTLFISLGVGLFLMGIVAIAIALGWIK